MVSFLSKKEALGTIFFINDVRACGFRHDWILIGLCLFDSSEFKVRVGEVKCNLTLQWAHLSSFQFRLSTERSRSGAKV